MKILIASTPATGHLNPLLAIARILIAERHEITCLTGTTLRDRVESSGAKFRPLPPDADFDPNDVFARAPALKTIPPGPEWIRVAIERLFVDNVQPQHDGLDEALQDVTADVSMGEEVYLGVLPMRL